MFIKNTIFRLHSLQQTPPVVEISGSNRKRSGETVSYPQTKNSKTYGRSFVTTSSSTSPSTPSSCPKCHDAHRLFKCSSFQKLGTQERWDFVKANKICRNCLWSHPLPCNSDKRCKKCNRNHHTLLHNEKGLQQTKVYNPQPKDDKSNTSTNVNIPKA